MVDWLDLTGHGAYVLLVGGQLAVTRGKALGFGGRAVGGLIWVALGAQLGLSSIVLWSSIFAAVDVYGWWSWRARQRHP